MAALAYWGQGDLREPWRREIPIADGAARIHLQGWWSEATRARPLSLEGLEDLDLRCVELQLAGSYLLLQDLPPQARGSVVVTSETEPDRFVVRTLAKPAPGASATGVLPRSLWPSRDAGCRGPFDADSAIAALQTGDLEGALAFAGELCLAGAAPALAKLVPAIAAYAQTHALHRGDEFGMFVAALSGVRGGE